MNSIVVETHKPFPACGIPVSISQQRVWVLDQLHPRNAVQNLACGLRFHEQVDRAKVEAALDETLRRHEILRTEFRLYEGSPVQFVLPKARVTVDARDLRRMLPSEREKESSRLAREETVRPFDLEHGPLLRATLFQLDDQSSEFLIVTHRIVCDEQSVKNVLREVRSRYLARENMQSQDGADVLQYRELGGSQATSAPADLAFWKQRLEDAPSSIELPADRQRPAIQTFNAAKQRIRIDEPVLRRLKILGQRHGADLFTTLLAGFAVLLSRHSRQDDIVVGTRVSGRGMPGLEGVIGPLENMLALRIDASGDPSFVAFLTRVRESVQGALSHQNVPFETLLKQLNLERDMSRHPLFQVMFTVQDGEVDSSAVSNVSLFEVENRCEQFDLSVEFAAKDNQLQATFSYNTDLFDAATIGRMIEHFRLLLEAAAKDGDVSISRTPLLSEEERNQILVEWNDTHVDYPRDIPLHGFFEDQVERTPDCEAVAFESQHLTYRQLNNRANQLAHHLQKCGVAPDVLVGVCAERSLELVIALLAILKAGGAYVPLDPDNPKDRLETMVRDANLPVVLTQTHLLDRLPEKTEGIFCLDRDWSTLQTETTDNPRVAVGGQNLAYAIYTSGSTGKPKGVPNVHQGIVNRLLWMQDKYPLAGKDRVLQKTPFSFDVSVWEFFWPLLNGATLVVARPGGHRDSAYIVNLIVEQGITVLHFVPSMLSIFLESPGLERCTSVRQVMASGEALPFELQQRFFQRMRAELHNLYGPTEAAVEVTYWDCRQESQQSIVPIGRPIANTQIYILDAKLQPVPIGVPGELHIGGIGLARGYLNRPELTAEKFIPDPFNAAPGSRLYKTGDLARFLPDGNIEYLGRIDFQVKLRGFRIELGEIEAVLDQCCGVRQAAVIVREDIPGDKRLVAYLIAAPEKVLDIEGLRRELKDKLPEYMVPSRFVVLERFPMTTSGKVNRKALPSPPQEFGAQAMSVAPRNEVESRLATLFASVLGVPSVGVTDNFFDLGGHSLLAGRLLAQIDEATGKKIPLSVLFRSATIESLAQLLEDEAEISAEQVVMEIQHGDNRQLPFFAIVPPQEESLGYAMLARHMGSAQTVYKIQGHAPVLEGSRPHTNEELQQLGEDYVAAMRSIQPHGPYCLGGLCDGTHIAEQVVLCLESQGEEVGVFAIFDTWVMQHSQIRWLWKVDYYRKRLQEMKNKSLSERIAGLKRIAANKAQTAIGQKVVRTDWQERYWPENFTPPRFQAPIVLFKRPKQQFYYINDPQMGWGKRSEGGVEIHEIDFHHQEILREPHVRQFGKTLAECIARISDRNLGRAPSHASLGSSRTDSVRPVRQDV